MKELPKEGQTKPARSITLKGIRPEARLYLVDHGCTLIEEGEQVTVIYPEGTTSTEIYPRTAYEWYRIKLPDNTELREGRPRLMGGDSCLYLLEKPNTG